MSDSDTNDGLRPAPSVETRALGFGRVGGADSGSCPAFGFGDSVGFVRGRGL